MMIGLCVLFAFQALGELIKLITGTILPGPVIGLVLLFLVLLIRRGVPVAVGDSGTRLIGALPLLLTPPSVGLFFLGDQLHGKGYAVALAVLVGTALTLVSTALIMTGLIRVTGKSDLQ